MKRVYISGLFAIAVIDALFWGAPLCASETTLEITSVAAIPHGEEGSHLSALKYPDVREIDIVLRIIYCAQGPAQATFLLAAYDPSGERVAKLKSKKTIEPGNSEIVFPSFFMLEKYFGENSLKLSVEASVKGVDTARTTVAISFTGAPKPEASFDFCEIRPKNDPFYLEFLPGDMYELNLFYTIGGESTGLPLVLRVFAVMDEQNYDVGNYRLSDPFWDESLVPPEQGFYFVRLWGRIPEKFIQFYRELHYFRLVAVLEFSNGVSYSAQGEGVIYDQFYGDGRAPVYDDQAYLLLDRSNRWIIDTLDEDVYIKRIRDLRGVQRVRRQGVYF